MFFYKIKKIFIFSLLFGVVFLFLFIASPFIENDLLSCHYAYAQTPPPTPAPPPASSSSSILEKIYAVLSVNPFKWPLIGMQTALGYGIEGAAHLLDQFVDATMTRNLLNSTAVKDTWAAVRDVCNLVFILALLFSAFATIFQVQKYHIKNTILMVILMALLINFSLPIARFVVDTGNVAMYYLLDILFGSANGAQVAAHITEESRVTCALIPHFCGGVDATEYAKSNNWAGILMSVIFLFLFFITLFTIAILFVIRLIALAVLLIFSPVGFAGMVLPSLQKHATSWWDQLFKYTFFGPIMIFMIAVAVKMMETFNQGSYSSDASAKGFVATILAMAPALVILWAGILTASKASIVGAGVVVGAAGRVAKWAGKKFSGYNMAGRHLKRWTSQRQAQKEDRARRRTDLRQEQYDRGTGWLYGKVGKKPKSTAGKIAMGILGGATLGISPLLRKMASSTARSRIQQSQESYDARVNDEMKKIRNKDNGMDIVASMKRIGMKGDDAKLEAHFRQAAQTGNNDDVAGVFGEEEATATGLAKTVRKAFRDQKRADRLHRSLGAIEGSRGKPHWLGSSGWDDDNEQFIATYDSDYPNKEGKYASGEEAGSAYRAMKQAQALFGQHPQGAMRKLDPDLAIIKYARNPDDTKERLPNGRFNPDLEGVLKTLEESDFLKMIDPENRDGVNQVPPQTVADIAKTIKGATTKWEKPVPGSRTEQLVEALKKSGRLKLDEKDSKKESEDDLGIKIA